MSRLSSLLRRKSGWHRQLALALLFALQGAITLSPLLEVTERGRLGAHAEEQGAQHKYQHDEATCAVCAVRSMHSTPAQSCPAVICPRQHTVAAVDAPWSPARRMMVSVRPRAPPQQT